MDDEEVADSWEEAADSGEMERRLEEKLRISQRERVSSGNPVHSLMKTAVVIQDASLPSAPPPQIRILKRPTTNGALSSPAAQTRPVVPVKTLAQREAEYAAARKRILGSATPEDTPQDSPNSDRGMDA
ncbi:SUZ RNA-binding domain-containing isoform X2 [Denticeps clupeoides]|uniref:SUZ RNA-binding domain-containing isoform X2 n=1 Tax=Denticeps clupeoides TaxID=299321 RepID=UPI0010A40240|nr:SUZ domain-containing protein 1-like isoform X2 [Denticeps clupeoides]